MEPFSLEQVVWLKLECPHKGSVKQLCISFFHEVDRLLHTNNQTRYGSNRLSIDNMVVHMAEIADRHALGLLVIDEIQHLMQAPGTGRDDLLNFLVALVNTIGIPVVIIGTPAALPLLQGAFRQARRASGQGSLTWDQHTNDKTWNYFIDQMWKYQWTRDKTPLDDKIRNILYEESQGIIDIVVKLYMLTQLHAIQLNSATGGKRGEILTVELFKYVSRESFRLIAPMITALKRNDGSLEKFDDLRPLNSYVLQAFLTASVRLSPTPCETVAAPLEAVSSSSVQDGSDAVLGSLETLGVPPDIAQVLLAQVKAENPGLSPLDLVTAIGEKLRERGPEANPVKTRPRLAKKGGATQRTDSADLRVIASEAKPPGTTAYDTLLTAGAIRPPLRDIAV